MTEQLAADGDLLAERAFRALRDGLRSGELRAGQFLSMPGLVTALGFPIAAVREAVKRADMAGLLSVMPKRGVVVMDAGPEATRACLDMRAMLDSEGARRRIAAGAVAGLEGLLAAHRAMLEEARLGATPDLPPRAMRTDLSLHDWLAAGLGNVHLATAYDANRDRIAVIQASRPFLADRIISAMEEHLAILTAVQAQDVAAAVAAIQQHHAQTLRWWGVR